MWKVETKGSRHQAMTQLTPVIGLSIPKQYEPLEISSNLSYLQEL